MDIGSNPNRQKNLIKKILPNTPAIVFPTIPKEYFFKYNAAILAPSIPTKILISEIKVAVITF